ncbi:hypothetical protein [Lactiplantibacillus daowaiensis]|uniref:Extracellular protein n=1 Tax=Lactiplantibacillus daowaiensis TaxID=2559918 RepID=A0ABW1RX48_9LACO|nr:hypothetical protein [Lactiplantibacillus daowaiensis]
MKRLKKGLILVAGLLLGGLVGPTLAQAQAQSLTVKIGNATVSRDYLQARPYYQAKQPVKLTVTTMTSQGQDAVKTVTLPKGTVVSGDAMGKELWLNRGSQLSYQLLKRVYATKTKPAPVVTTITAKKRYFQRAKTPSYMPTWSQGDLYLGGKAAVQHFVATKVVRLTADGYLEVHTVNSTGTITVKPTSAAKLTKTTGTKSVKNLYFSQRVKGVTMKQVAKAGKAKYRLQLKNLHQPQYTPGQSDDDIPYAYYSLYSLGGKTYYTKIAEEAM